MQSTDDFGVNVSFNVQNTGGVLGAEAAQVYVHAVSSQVERPDAELKGFVKVILSPGESKRVTVRLDVSCITTLSVFPKSCGIHHLTLNISDN